MKKPKCKICRRLGEKLFLKGDRCYSQNCAMVRKPYAPGQKGTRRKGRPSEYGKQLAEKQKIKRIYDLREAQFKKYIAKVFKERSENASDRLINLLESRLDSVVFRLGFGNSRGQAKQMVSHGYFLVDGKSVDIPSYQVKKDEIISLKPSKEKKKIITELKEAKAKEKVSWVDFDSEKMEGKMIHLPTLEEVSPPVNIQAIFEFYSR
jgi:small subunit ribosomal protein S4